MISVKVEKEIKQENHIFGSFSLRQVIVLAITGFIILLIYFITRLDFSMMAPIGVGLGVLAYFFGFKKRDGLYYEYFLFKKIKNFVFMNTRRRYRTKNKYITMLNKSYLADKMTDMQDRKKRKAYERKMKQSKNKKTKLKVYV